MDALASLDSDFVLDGELVALDSKGRPSFQILQNNLSRTLPVYFYCFDLLNRDGETLVSSPIEQRRDLLHRIVAAPEDPLRLSPLLQASSGQVLEAVRKLGLEGVVGKRTAFIYEPGERSGAWIKLRTNMEQEFVIGGYVPGHVGSMHCSWAFTRRKNSSSFTADVYGDGESERTLAPWLARHRDEVVLATKVRFSVSDPEGEGLDPDRIRAACDASLRRLGVDVIDLYQVHAPDPKVPLEDTLAALDGLVQAGKVRTLGASNFPAWLLAWSVSPRTARLGTVR